MQKDEQGNRFFIEKGKRTYLEEVVPYEKAWLNAVDAGLGAEQVEAKPTNQFFVEAEGAIGATLSVKAGKGTRNNGPWGTKITLSS